ncbi:hypothetical protein CLU79DRAFT_368638 [Phycomyces nitens]|nr:hypothetical protein CLU79DRAFT_368638 [Phycomyces nitens]
MPNENSARVVFLIDTNDPSIDASKIKQIALQILLYFYDYVDKKVTWGYRFFSSESAAVDAAKHPLYPFMPEHISAFETKCARKLRQESLSSVPRSPVGKRQTTSYSVLKETMMQILAEFQWASTDSYLNTTRQKTKPTCFQSNKQGHGVETKNHVYMLTNCPDTYEAMLRYVGYSDLEDADATEDQKIEHMAQAIHFMAQDMQKSLLGNYIQRQISFNWINTLGNPNEPEKSFQKPISHGLSKFLGLFGGHMIPYYLGLVNHAKYGCSFSTLFSSYFSSEIDTVMKNSESTVSNPAHSMESYITHIKDKTKDDTPFWEGEFYLGHDAYFLSERQGARKEYQVRLKPFFRTTRELPLEERNFPTSVNDLFSRINVFRTVALINNANVRAHWFENDGQESKRLEFVMTSKDPDTATFIDLIDSLIASHQVILVDLQARRASRSNGPHVHTQALLQPLTSGFMNVILLTSPVEADELQSLESGARFPKIHPPETTQLDLPSLLEVAPFSIRAINHYKRVAANGPPIILNESPEVLEILTAYREKKKAEEEAKSKQKVQSKPATGKIKTVDTPIARLPIDEDEFVTTVKRLYLEALYTNKTLLCDFGYNCTAWDVEQKLDRYG